MKPPSPVGIFTGRRSPCGAEPFLLQATPSRFRLSKLETNPGEYVLNDRRFIFFCLLFLLDGPDKSYIITVR